MQFRELTVAGALEVVPQQFHDDRGSFAEGFRMDLLGEQIGHGFVVRQTNVSVSVAGALRGLHYADVPPSQAKYVTATSGSFLDVVVDLRTGSPSFGAVDVVRLDAVDRRAIYVPEGVGHLLACLESGTAMYLCTEVFNPVAERAITPLDPDLRIPLPEGFAPVLSAKDVAAPTLAAAAEQGLLPSYAAVQELHARLARH